MLRMASEDQDQRTEAATPKKRREAAEQGDVLQSRELSTALVMLSGGGWIALFGPRMVGACEDVLGRGLTFDHRIVEHFDPTGAFIDLLLPVLVPLAALFGMTLAAAIGAPAMLGSLGFRWSAIGFKPEKLDPFAGLQRIFGLQGLIELGKGLLKIVLMGSVGYWLLRARLPAVMGLGAGAGDDLKAGLVDTGHVFVIAVLTMTLALAAIAGLDVPAQLIQRARRLRMSKQDIKDEHKQTEGSPEAKGAIKRRMRETLSNSARKAVKEATVVLTNPTHFAVALRYRPGFDIAPVVVARGKDEVAAAIRTLADAHAVPILNYPQLTRALYFTARAGQLVREDLYIAVATVLAFVFNLDRAMAEGTMQPRVDVPEGARFDENGKL
jgi:flagellar biosynthetic protein FlhB